MVVVLATGENHLRAAWRICLALGAIPPLTLLYLRYASHDRSFPSHRLRTDFFFLHFQNQAPRTGTIPPQ
jgi:hypothetical protein